MLIIIIRDVIDIRHPRGDVRSMLMGTLDDDYEMNTQLDEPADNQYQMASIIPSPENIKAVHDSPNDEHQSRECSNILDATAIATKKAASVQDAKRTGTPQLYPNKGVNLQDRWRQAIYYLWHICRHEPPVPEGMARVRWTCVSDLRIRQSKPGWEAKTQSSDAESVCGMISSNRGQVQPWSENMNFKNSMPRTSLKV